MSEGDVARLRPSARAQQRHGRILAALQAADHVAVADLAAELAVSEMTVRRDLLALQQRGRLTRVHGGAAPIQAPAPVRVDREEPGFAVRLRTNYAAKHAIAAQAALLVGGLRTIALDVGTTTCLLAERLCAMPPASGAAGAGSVFTNNLPAARALSQGAREVYLPGGRLRPGELSIVGAAAAAEAESLWFDVAVLGVSGITEDGLFDYSREDSALKRVYLRRAELKLVLCDASKFQRMSLVNIAPLEAVDLLVTDARPPAHLAAALDRAGVELRIAPPPA